MTARDIMTITDARENYVTSLDLQVNKGIIDNNFVEQFTQVLTPYKEGTCPVRVFFINEKKLAAC